MIVTIVMTRLSSLAVVCGVVVATACLLVTHSVKITRMLASLNQHPLPGPCAGALVTGTKRRHS